ncbi:FtsX-like permease family protein [Lacticaseibacillus jixianensis]|uniref:FtsX-like permease family protein n=1 Tax=Lacticaseibacillus jixianensis TaxID=2486012 RepID=A0ABW4B6Y6_9LACO|nr:ABC transporter permease [Lacticaseibacillus jixianensis]
MKPMRKNMWREIGANKGRFIAIVLIILLGTLTFVGVRAAGPGLEDSMDRTVKDQRLTDVQLLATTGFTQQDVKTAEQVSGAKAELTKFKYVTGGKDDLAIALYGYQAKVQQDRLTVTAGRLPHAAGEVALDTRAKTEYHYRLGQTFTFSKDADLKRRAFKIVGFVDSPRYVDNNERGSTNVGDGTVRFFAYVQPAQLNLDVATLLAVRFGSLQDENSYSDAYKDDVAAKLTALKRAFKPRAKARDQALTAAALKPIAAEQAKLDQANAQLTAATAQVEAASQGAMTTTPELTAQAAQLAAAQKKLDAAKQKARAAIHTSYTWQTRADLPGFASFGDSADRIAAIANVFPVFFFLIAALITFTTITRMVEEARGQIGTFKALGYGKWAIARNYLMYALMAGLLGAVVGSVAGNLTLPRFIVSLYDMVIPLTPTIPLMWGSFAIALVASLLATVGAAWLVTRRELRERPAELMRPAAPKSAKRILLERIKPLWRRLSFNQKVSYRNLFRYKSRMIMTIIGIAGGTGLLLTGFGLRDSIGTTASHQYDTVFHYDATVALKSAGKQTKALSLVKDSGKYQAHRVINADTGKAKANGKQIADINLYTPLKRTGLNGFVTLSQHGDRYQLPASGIVIAQKIANQLGVQKGDTLTFTRTGKAAVKVKVSGITTNYIGVFAYMSPQAYTKAFGHQPVASALLLKLRPMTDSQRNQLAHRLLKQNAALGTSFKADETKSVGNMGSSLNPVVLIFILLSGVLSFVVLYNLTNINVSERIRELSTIKVLGFYDREVTMYIVRENIVMTIVGVLCGYGVGYGLLAYILHQAETTQVIFPVVLAPLSYVWATLLMAGFTAVVMLVTHKRLQRIDMVGALKSSE